MTVVMTVVMAFPCPLSNRHTIARRQIQSFQSLRLSQEDIWSLVDEAVLLHSVVDSQSFSSDNSVSDDLKRLRKSEITTLVEDMVLDIHRINGRSTGMSIRKKSTALQDLSLETLSRLLEDTIFEGYQKYLVPTTSSFKDEEVDAWTRRIQEIQVVFEDKLTTQTQQQSSSSSSLLSSSLSLPLITIDTVPSNNEDTGIAKFVTRLEQLQTLVTVPSSSPTRHFDLCVVPTKDSDDDIPFVVTTTDYEEGTLVKASQGDQIQTVLSKGDVLTETNNEKISLFLGVDEKYNSKEVDTDPPQLSMESEEIFPTPNKNKSVDTATNTKPMQNLDVSIEMTSPSMSTEEMVLYEPLDNQDTKVSTQDIAVETLSSSKQSNGVDAVSALLSAAAIGAVAVTKIPYFATGVALASIVKQSVDFAKNGFRRDTQGNGTSQQSNSPSEQSE